MPLCLPILLCRSGRAGRGQRKEDQHGTLPILSGASQGRKEKSSAGLMEASLSLYLPQLHTVPLPVRTASHPSL